jgi:hypothetical protein
MNRASTANFAPENRDSAQRGVTSHCQKRSRRWSNFSESCFRSFGAAAP